MRKQIYLCILLSVAAALLAPAHAVTTSGSSTSAVDALSIYSLQVSPNPIFAGSNVTINLQLYDTYTSQLQNVNLELEGSYPILNVSPSNPYLISSIGQGLYGGSFSYFTYNIHVPKNTPSGNYTLDLVAEYQTTQSSSQLGSEQVTGTSIMPITFYVHGTPAITINPSVSQVIPGSIATVSLSVMNSGYGDARNITVNILNSSNFSATGTKKFLMGSLAAGASSTLAASYIVGSQILNGTYSIPVSVTYYSDQGLLYSQTIDMAIGVRVQNPNIVVTVLSASPQTLYSGYNQSLTLSIQNIGHGAANNVSVEVLPGPGINILSSVRDFFIGSLAAGQSQDQNILITTGNYTSPQASILARMDYYSDNYQYQFYKNQTINLSVAQSSIFRIGSGSYRILPGETTVPLNLTITNTGNIDAQQVQLSFQSSYPLTPVAGSAYIPQLMPGQSATVTFLISVDSAGAPGSYPITVYESWKQPNGAVQQTYTGSNNYFAVVSSSSSASGTGAVYAIIAIVIIVIAVMAYRRFGKKPERKKVPKAL